MVREIIFGIGLNQVSLQSRALIDPNMESTYLLAQNSRPPTKPNFLDVLPQRVARLLRGAHSSVFCQSFVEIDPKTPNPKTQLSDYFEERIPQSLVESEGLRNMGGSMIAGVFSGYLSHIPHNLSTLKLMTPNKTYWQHLGSLVAQSEARVPTSLSPGVRNAVATVFAILFPRAVMIRTVQIVGSFTILNGTINTLKYAELPTSIPTAF